MPKVSVCIPVFNVENYISSCVESVITQSITDIEIIVVNDCTPDNSMEIIRKYADKDNRIRIIEHKLNKGLMVTRQTAYMAATGDYITFLDSDDILTQGALDTLYTAAVREDADIVCGTIQYVPCEGACFLWKNNLNYGSDKISVYKSLLRGECGHNLCSKLFKRELLQKYSYKTFDGATNGEDGMLFYQVVENSKKIIAIDKIVYLYYQNTLSSTNVRLDSRALQSIVIANSLRIETAGKHPELRELASKKVTEVLFGLKLKGYEIKSYLVAMNMEKYYMISNAIKELGVLYVLFAYIRLIYHQLFKDKMCKLCLFRALAKFSNRPK